MPNVRDTDEYRLVRRREVYRAAFESALQDGTVTPRERDILATLAELGLSARDVVTIEREAAGPVSDLRDEQGVAGVAEITGDECAHAQDESAREGHV